MNRQDKEEGYSIADSVVNQKRANSPYGRDIRSAVVSKSADGSFVRVVQS